MIGVAVFIGVCVVSGWLTFRRASTSDLAHGPIDGWLHWGSTLLVLAGIAGFFGALTASELASMGIIAVALWFVLRVIAAFIEARRKVAQ